MSSESTGKKPSYIPIAGALLLGVIIGAAISSGDDEARKVKREAEARIAAVEAAMEEQAAATSAAIEEQAAAASDAARSAADAASETAAQQIAALEARLDEVAQAGSDEVAALQARLDEIAQATSEEATALQARVEALSAELVEMASDAASETSSAMTDASGEAPPEPRGEGPAKARDVALTVGQTTSVGGLPVFMSRIDEEAREIRIVVIGAGPRKLGADLGPVTLSNGCVVAFDGFEGRAARLVATCP